MVEMFSPFQHFIEENASPLFLRIYHEINPMNHDI